MAGEKGHILWVDDEIEMLKPHIIFLTDRGYKVTPVTNAEDALDLIKETPFDLVLLDEMMSGMDGLTALEEMKTMNPSLPVIMITKSEEEMLMEQAIGSKIDDYLTKPVNPSQILLVCKKIIEGRKITGQSISKDYTNEFNQIVNRMMGPMHWKDWIDIHLKLSEWDVELDAHPDLGLKQTLYDQKRDCNVEFGRYIERSYLDWIHGAEDRPPLSVDIVKDYVLPHVEQGANTLLVILDNLRLDQWMTVESLLREFFKVKRDYYYSILPTATPYSRNAIFAGLFPGDIERLHPDLWSEGGEADDVSRNRYEHQLLEEQMARLMPNFKSSLKYAKVLDIQEAKSVSRKLYEFVDIPVSAIVINFVDILAHTRSSVEVIKEMIPNESAFRSITRSWFEHSPFFQALREIQHKNFRIVITSDHGSIRGLRGAKVIGDRETSTSLRYKYGRNIKANAKNAMIVKDPQTLRLPARGVNTNYLIAKEDYYFVYPTNYHYYLNYYADSFQHGGISLEEMILPIATLEKK